MAAPERLAFVCQWRDPVQNVVWTYQLMVFPASSEVELFDIKNRRTFLKKTKLEGLKRELFFVGGKVTLFGRQLDITDYGDAYTQRTLAGAQQRCGNPAPPAASRQAPPAMPLAKPALCHDACFNTARNRYATKRWPCLCRTLAIIKPDAIAHLSEVVQAAYNAGFLITCVAHVS